MIFMHNFTHIFFCADFFILCPIFLKFLPFFNKKISTHLKLNFAWDFIFLQFFTLIFFLCRKFLILCIISINFKRLQRKKKKINFLIKNFIRVFFSKIIKNFLRVFFFVFSNFLKVFFWFFQIFTESFFFSKKKWFFGIFDFVFA